MQALRHAAAFVRNRSRRVASPRRSPGRREGAPQSGTGVQELAPAKPAAVLCLPSPAASRAAPRQDTPAPPDSETLGTCGRA